MKKFKKEIKAFGVFFLILLSSSFFFLPTSHALNELSTAPLIIKLGEDKAIDYTVQKITMFIPSANIVSINSMNSLTTASRSFGGYVIYVGHGEISGLHVGNTLVSWTDIKTMIQNSPSSTYILASCYSKAAEAEGKVTFGFRGKVDVDEAALWAVTLFYSCYDTQYGKAHEVMKYFSSVMIDKFKHPERNFVATLDNPYQGNSHEFAGIWWNEYSDDPNALIRYTHPDYYNGYPAYYGLVGTADWWSLDGGQGIVVAHLPDWYMGFADLISEIDAVLYETIAGLLAILSVPLGVMAGMILGLLAVEEWYVINYVVKSENGDAWGAATTPVYGGCPPWSFFQGFEIKLGGLPWIEVVYYYAYGVGQWYFWPDGGGQYLDRGGI